MNEPSSPSLEASEPEPGVSFEALPPVSGGTPDTPMAQAEEKKTMVAIKAAPPTTGGRQLPHSIEAEEKLLSCFLIPEDEGASLDRAIANRIRADSFYKTEHQAVFAHLLQMRFDKKPISVDVLYEELVRSDSLKKVGGLAFLTQITQKSGTTAEVAYFLKTVRDKSLLRELIRQATTITEEAYNCAGDADELAASAQQRIVAPIVLADPRLETLDWPETVTADQLHQSPPPTPPILIEGLLYQGGTMLLSGPSKSHKTYTMLDQAVAIADGRRWLNFNTTQAPVLYLNLELQAFATNHRLDQICQARGTPLPKNLHLWNLRGKNVTLAQLSARLAKKIHETGSRCVMIDPHYKISSVSGMEENSNDDQGQLLSALEAICAQEHASLILSHHFAKGDASAKNAIDRASGGGVFARWGDVMLTFTPHEQNDAMTVEMSLRNFAPVDPFVVTWIHPRWQTDESLNPEDLKTSRGPKEKNKPDMLLKCLGDETLGFAEWEKRSGMSNTTFKRKRQQLIDDGLVIQFGNLYKKAK